ncbi:MAG TPA: VTT domain-containing protein [Candidatus Polarisedimenticolaceae bacterium]|nr:VTT domain-containing protein [Candidatus Polarisedimenticolaceae bacterium]
MTPPLRDRLASPKADPLRWLGILAALAVAAIFCTERGRAALVSALPSLLDGLGSSGPALFVGVFALAVAAFFPVLPFVFVGAVTYGLWGGTAVNVAGTALGASLAYAAARVVGSGLLQRTLPRGWDERLERLLERQPTYAVFVLRVLPFFPYAPTSFALGLTRVRFRAFLWGTLAGSVPMTLVYTWLFARAGAVLRRPGARLTELLTLESVLPFGAALLLLCASAFVRRKLAAATEGA